ncbi:hypothetical protein V498_08951, partial [Pseudogymnoascus sp. VKM F-4517 (FW-2822)]
SPPSTKPSSPTSPTSLPTSTSHETERANRLFALLSARSDIDHPICTECTSLLLTSLSARLSASLRERDAYTAFLTHLHQTAPTPASLAASRSSLSSARDAEEAATSSLLALERTQTALAAELASLSASASSLEAAEAEFWHSHNTFSTSLAAAQATHASLSAAATHDARLLDLLQRTNVHNDSFPISHDGTGLARDQRGVGTYATASGDGGEGAGCADHGVRTAASRVDVADCGDEGGKEGGAGAVYEWGFAAGVDVFASTV